MHHFDNIEFVNINSRFTRSEDQIIIVDIDECIQAAAEDKKCPKCRSVLDILFTQITQNFQFVNPPIDSNFQLHVSC